MLRLWRDRILASLAPGGVAWLRLSHGRQGEVRDKQHVRIDAQAGEAPWAAAAAAFQKQSASWLTYSSDVSVVLSNEFVRYALIPPTAGVNGEAEALALARFHFGKIHGSRAQAWDMRLSPAPRGASRMAAAVDSTLIKHVRDCFPHGAQARLQSVQPWLMAAYNSARGQVPGAGAWLLLMEPERACVALLSGSTWKSVQNIRVDRQDADHGATLLERERMRLDGAPAPHAVLVHDARESATALLSKGQWQPEALKVRWPTGVLESRDRAYHMALAAL